jgi:arylsulfatase A-like enzyme
MLASPPNVVLLSVDTLRADYLGVYGCPVDTSPEIDAFAGESLVFTDCVCEVPLTGPSMGSMLTSRFPRQTGTTRNGLRMPGDVPTVAEQFREAGYHTFCVQSNWTLKAGLSGMDRGFDVYDDDFHKKRWGIIKAERRADEVARIALERLAARDPDKPFFAWIHFTDPHAPYTFHGDFNPAGRPRFFMPNEQKVRLKYASEVAYTGYHIGRVLAALPPGNTRIVFVADHGESLYEHGYLGHGRRIHQTGMRIPLMIHGKGVTPGRTSEPARGIDIGPTLLGLAGLPVPDSMLGIDLTRKAPAPDRVRVFETYGGAVPGLPGAKALMADVPPMRQGVIHEGWKLILGGGAPQLFHLPSDPGELDDRAAAEPARVNALRRLVETWDRETRRADGAEQTDLSQDDIRALEALGYVE